MIRTERMGCFKIEVNLYNMTMTKTLQYPIKIHHRKVYEEAGFTILVNPPRGRFKVSRYYACGTYTNNKDAQRALLTAQSIAGELKYKEALDNLRVLGQRWARLK